MGVSIIYEYLENFYTIRNGLSAIQLYSGECPRCGKSGSDLRVYAKTEDEMEDLFSDGVIEDLATFKFSSCHHCGGAICFYNFTKYHDGLTLDETREIVDSDDEFIRTREEKEDEEDEKPFPPLVKLEGDIRQHVINRGLTDETIEKYGILFSVGNFSYKGKEIYFKDRIFFPIYSRIGKLCGFQGRAIGKSSAKYLTAVWMNKSEVLFGCHLYPSGVSNLIICEGVFDALAWVQIGLNAVASFGKSISQQQVDILLDIKPEVLYLGVDRDSIVKSFEFCERNQHRFKSIKIIRMPVGKDADEMTKDELTEAIVNAVEYSWETKILFMMEDSE